MVLETSMEVWNALCASGLEEKRAKTGLDGYDQELVRELNRRLFPNSKNSLSANIRHRPPSIEAFFNAFLPALKPFSMMLCETLSMFEAANARRTDHNLQIAFNFSEADPSVVMSLQQFREQAETIRRIARPVIERRWSTQSLFGLIHRTRSVSQSEESQACYSHAAMNTEAVRDWVARNGRPEWTDFPGFPRTGNVALDAWLTQADDLIVFMQAELRKLGPTYRDLARALNDMPFADEGYEEIVEDEEIRLGRSFFVAAHDFWPNSFAEVVCLAVEKVRASVGKEQQALITTLIEAFQEGFAAPPRRERTLDQLERELQDLLNMPIWQRRHELYAVWVGSRIAQALGHAAWSWHPDGDTLRFPFSGAQLATVQTPGKWIEFWTEKRTDLPTRGVSGRKQIQPDYRLVEMPVHRPNATCFVVECKQYRKWSAKNFGAAIADYASGCPGAPVVLVNYGPIGSTVLDQVDPAHRSRTYAIGSFRPDNPEALAVFEALVRSSFPMPATFPLEPSMGPAEARIDLAWDAPFDDLDLHLSISESLHYGKTYHVGFNGNVLDPADEPWIFWNGDVREFPGHETAVIHRILPTDYEIYVHLFRGPLEQFPNYGVIVTVSIGGRPIRVQRSGRRQVEAVDSVWWHVGTLHGLSKTFETVDRLLPTPPSLNT